MTKRRSAHSFEKRRREIAKQKKREEKAARKRAGKDLPEGATPGADAEPDADGNPGSDESPDTTDETAAPPLEAHERPDEAAPEERPT